MVEVAIERLRLRPFSPPFPPLSNSYTSHNGAAWETHGSGFTIKPVATTVKEEGAGGAGISLLDR